MVWSHAATNSGKIQRDEPVVDELRRCGEKHLMSSVSDHMIANCAGGIRCQRSLNLDTFMFLWPGYLDAATPSDRVWKVTVPCN